MIFEWQNEWNMFQTYYLKSMTKLDENQTKLIIQKLDKNEIN